MQFARYVRLVGIERDAGNLANNRKRRLIQRVVEKYPALSAFCLCGTLGVLVDLDHFASVALWRYVDSTIVEGRIFHTPLLIASCLLVCGMGAHPSRLHPKLVLMSIFMFAATTLVLVYSPLVV